MKRKLLLGAAVAALVAGHALTAQAELKPGAAARSYVGVSRGSLKELKRCRRHRNILSERPS